MSKYVAPTSGQLTVGICDRCRLKFQLSKLIADPDKPGLRVCRDTCADQRDPWKLPPRRPEDITVRNLRPEEPLES
jgi:hypothetical protein